MVDEIVDEMLRFGETHLLGIGRGTWLQPNTRHRGTDIGPLWAHDGDLPSLEKLREGGMGWFINGIVKACRTKITIFKP